jgi:hypothetical protein
VSKPPDVSRPLIIKRVPVSQVIPWDKNPRGIKTADFERLKKQILTLGVYKPLVAYKDGEQYVVLGGNMRIRALKDLGIREVEVSVVEAETEAKRIEYALSDNDRAGFYEEDKLAELALPHIANLDLDNFKIDLGEPLDIKAVIEKFGPDFGEPNEKEFDENIETENECPKCGYKW